MRRSLFTIASLLLILMAVNHIDAQACGRYYINISVQGPDGKPVRGAKVKLEPITADETKGAQFAPGKADLAAFSVSFSEGHSFEAFHRVVVSAAGYRTAENQIKALSCQSRQIIVRLSKTGSPDPAVWQFDNRVSIEVVGTDGKQIDDATLTVTAGKAKPVDEEMKFGFANFDLPNGKYTFRIHADGYLDKEIDADLTTIANFYLKVQMMPEGAKP